MVARVLAVVAAIAMVAGSLAIRSRLDDDEEATASGAAVRVTCATELAAVCAAWAQLDPRLRTTVEPAPETAERLIAARSAEAGLDGWLAPGPWGRLVEDARQRANRASVLESPAEPVARSPLIAVLDRARAAGLRSGPCRTDIGWRCLGDAAGGGGLRLGAPPAGEAEGLLVRAAAVAGYLGTEDFSIDDFTGNLDATAWLRGLEDSIAAARSGGAGDFHRFLVARGAADGFLLTEASAAAALAGAADRQRYELVILAPPATADLAVATRKGGGLGDRRKLDDVLAGNGWRVGGRNPSPGSGLPPGPLPRSDGLPSAGVLQALQEAFR